MERIHVSVRARPLSAEDTKTSPWRIAGNSIFIPQTSTKFEFDKTFGEDCKTVDVYEARTKDIVSAAVDGFNGTIFAYGQTNSGKTHTMRGSRTEPGVIPLAVVDMFNILQENVEREFLLRMSYLEIYNEEINDLLAPEHRKLQIHENLDRGVHVAGLREEIVVSAQQVLDLMTSGECHRHIGETNMNVYSSRSHTIFRMVIESRERSGSGESGDDGSACDAVRVSVLNLVDLAGSERAAKTGAEGVRLKEGSHINKSLMTLGTVIKKLSEGAESQGGHVPYRDSKLTRILQPALGGNANTAIICNITLAQIHADETKSSLQFASRALRIKNCAHVNEILTDAALLKRQKKEIEQLRAKLQGNHSEHLEDEVLNLRNHLLQSELERERITLELEKAQAARDRELQEQAKKIKNLSSMVLYSNRDDNRDNLKKVKRRNTWAPINLSGESEVDSGVISRASTVTSSKCEMELVPFKELTTEDEFYKEREDNKDDTLEEFTFPNPSAVLNVTNRRKVPRRKTHSFPDTKELVDVQAAYNNLLLRYDAERTSNAIEIDCLKRKLAEANSNQDLVHNENVKYIVDGSMMHDDNLEHLRESELILVIKQLQEKIKNLEIENSSYQQNLNRAAELAAEQNLFANEKLEELQEELLIARANARETGERHASNNIDSLNKISSAVEELISEVQSSKVVVENAMSLVDDVLRSFSTFSSLLVEFDSFRRQSSLQHEATIDNHEKLHLCIKQRVSELENQKSLLEVQSATMQSHIEELKLEASNREASLLEQHELERSEFLAHIQCLEKDISSLSSCSLAKEKENLRKDLEKTRGKLKETESKLKTAIQEKTKLEGEKAYADREIRRLQGQKTLLDRDISKRDSLAIKNRDSVVERSSKVVGVGRGKGFSVPSEQAIQEENEMELEAFVSEAKNVVAALEEELAAAESEKEEALSRNKELASELENVIEKLELLHSELDVLKEEKLRLEESSSDQQRLETSIKILLEEKEELAMQLVNSLLEIEEEKAILCAKEKASIKAAEEKTKNYTTQVMSLTQEMLKIKDELESYKEECEVLKQKLTFLEDDAKQEKKSSVEKAVEIDKLKNDLKLSDANNLQTQRALEKLTLELQHAREKMNILKDEVNSLEKYREELLKHIDQLKQSAESNQHQNQVSFSNERAKLRMRLRGTQAQLDALRYRYKVTIEESELMNKKFDEASKNFKNLLAAKGLEVSSLKKELASTANI